MFASAGSPQAKPSTSGASTLGASTSGPTNLLNMFAGAGSPQAKPSTSGPTNLLNMFAGAGSPQAQQIQSQLQSPVAGSTSAPKSTAKPSATPVPRSGGNPASAIASAAESLRGMSSASGPDGGRNGCVWAVNKVYKKAGITPPWGNSLYVPTAEADMVKAGYTQVSSADRQPGDVMVMYDNQSPPQAHIGVVLQNGNVLSNSSGKASLSWEDSPEGYNSYYGNTGKIYRMPNSTSSPDIAQKDSSVPNSASSPDIAQKDSPVPTQASIQSTTTQSTSRTIKPPSSRSRVIPLPIPSPGGGSQNSPILSGSGANQKKAPSFSSTDVNNPELIVVKAIYNIVGN